MSRAWRILAAVAVLGLALVVSGPANLSAHAAQPTPSPTLGSTNSPRPNPPGATDSSPRDYQGAVWVVAAAVVVAAVVGGGTFYLTRTHRLDLSQRSTPQEEREAEADREHRSTGHRG